MPEDQGNQVTDQLQVQKGQYHPRANALDIGPKQAGSMEDRGGTGLCQDHSMRIEIVF